MPGLHADTVPDVRVNALGTRPVREDGEFVLYWMVASRRTTWNFGLQRAVEWARRLDRPLVVLEALRCDYRWASDRLHGLLLDGMAENERRLRDAPVLYHPYVEPRAGAGDGLVAALGRRACVVVTDEFPCFFLPRMVRSAAESLPVRTESVDGNGLLPLRAAGALCTTAQAFRRYLQKNLRPHLAAMPLPEPLVGVQLPRLATLPAEVLARWPAASAGLLAREPAALAALPIDHGVGVVACRGGSAEAGAAVKRFLAEGLPRYADGRNHPDDDVASGLSPWLHFGHVSAHAVFAAIARQEGWTPARLGSSSAGLREGWWNLSPAAEAFVDQLVTWRELGLHWCAQRDDHDRLSSLPEWARATLARHENDPREHTYSLEQFQDAATHDPLWNAAQRQLRQQGRMHNYLRMLWGKKVIEWTRSPQEALDVLLELNNRWALDGRDPNSSSGILWCFGRHDRPWAPERPVFGSVRWMSSANTARKLHVKEYMAQWAHPEDPP